MYCGDTVPSIVAEVGTKWSKFGFSGEDKPSLVFHTGVLSEAEAKKDDAGDGDVEMANSPASGAIAGEAADTRTKAAAKHLVAGRGRLCFRPNTELRSPYAVGVGSTTVDDWDLLEAVWAAGFADLLRPLSAWRSKPAADTSAAASSFVGANRVPDFDGRVDLPVLVSESLYTVQPQREKHVEMMFETFGVPALYMAKEAVLTSVSFGRATALVVDFGADSTSVVPVHDGYALNKGVQRSDVGGDMLTHQLTKLLRRKGAALRPQYAFSRKKLRDGSWKLHEIASATAHPSFEAWSVRNLVDDIKETCCSVSLPLPDTQTNVKAEPGAKGKGKGKAKGKGKGKGKAKGNGTANGDATAADGDDSGSQPTTHTYQLPDGSEVQLSESEAQLIPELLFSPAETMEELSKLGGDTAGGGATAGAANGSGSGSGSSAVHKRDRRSRGTAQPAHHEPLAALIHASLLGVDVDIRKDLCANVILAGGASLFPTLPQRLHYELSRIIPSSFRVRILVAPPLERRFSSWTGGSILTQLGSFQQLWMSKQEYEEEGAGLIESKCP